MKKFQLFLIILFCGGVFESCTTLKDKAYVEPKIGEVSNAFKAYTVFGSGSYWIYKNQLNGIEDSVIVREVTTQRRFHTVQGRPGFFYKAYEMLYSSGPMALTIGEVTGGYADTSKDTLPENFRIYFDNGRYFSILTPKYPLGEEQYLGINEGNYTNTAFHRNFELQGKSYSDVYITRVKDYHDGNDTVYMHFFLAKDAGIIRYIKQSNTENSDWILTKYDLKAFEGDTIPY
ncbi:MAG: hypothetical protein RBR87_15715 [Bacteroidales bacterium]|jgi:hypothetical protein|nr:hypothetical protein [Bacteroidales bacterium]